MNQAEWQARFKQWQDFAQHINARAQASKQMRDDRAWAIAASVGIGRCGCSLHNASIDTELRGWCFGRPDRLKAAKRATYMLNDWREARLAENIINRKYKELLQT